MTALKNRKDLYTALLLCAIALMLVLQGVFVWPKAPEMTVPTQPPKPTVPPNPYTAADFAYNGLFLECLAAPSKAGIDVSSHQGEIDWPAVKAAGVEFVFVRLGYRGYKNGEIKQDIYAKTNLAGAKAAGLQVGAYFFSQALNEQEALDEAAKALEVLDGFALDLPLVYDWEYINGTARTGQSTKEEVMACVNAYCGAVTDAGYAPMVYFNRDLAKSHLELTALNQYPFWLAMYTDQMTYPYKVTFWQYSDHGRIPGIKGDVDLNIWLM